MMLDRTTPPLIKDPIDFDYTLPPCQTHILDNGIPLYALNLGAQEVVQVEWIFEAGIWQESKTGVAQTTAALLKNGTASRTAARINEAIEQYGATLKISANNDFAVITLSTLSKHLHHLLPVVVEVIREPSFSQEELDIYKQNAVQRLKVNLLRGDFVSNRYIDAFVFGRQHPYGKYTELEDIEALTREDLVRFHRDWYTPDNCRIFLSGNFTGAHLNNIQQLFGRDRVQATAVKESRTYRTAPAGDRLHRIVNDPAGVQGAIRMARPFIERTHPDFAPALVMNTIFGGYFGSRLMSNIREEKGYTYGIYSQFYAYRNASMLLIATEAGKEVSEATVEEIIREAGHLRDQPVPEGELILVKNYILGNLLGDLDGAFSIMARWKTLILNGLTADHFDSNIRTYKEVTSETIQDMARKYLNTEDFYNLIVY